MAKLINAQERHAVAMRYPEGHERPILTIRWAIEEYIAFSEAEYPDEDGQWRDYVLGHEIGRMLAAFVGLLNGELGRLDGGTLDAWARSTAARIGYDLDRNEYVG